jgi:hypothetical protein
MRESTEDESGMITSLRAQVEKLTAEVAELKEQNMMLSYIVRHNAAQSKDILTILENTD